MAEGDAELADLYRDSLLDYYRSTSHKGTLPHPDLRSHGVNPVCGDEIELTLNRRRGGIGEIRYSGHGCVISQASGAIMAEALEGQPLDAARSLIESFRGLLLKNAPADSLPEALEEAKALEGVRKFPVRIKCALLPWNTLRLVLDPGAPKGAAEYWENGEAKP